jgi:hypothetical protein
MRRAMKVAVESSAPTGYFESFAARVMARTENASIAPPESTTQEREHTQDKREVGLMDVTTKPTPKVEMTGLHDLQAMARNTKERLAQKHPDDAEADLLATVASSGSFGQVVLPEPGREVAPKIAHARPSLSAPAQMAGGFGSGIVDRRPSRVPAVLLTTVLIVGAGAVAAWFLVPKYLARRAQPVAAVETQQAPDVEAAPAAETPPEVAPSQAPATAEPADDSALAMAPAPEPAPAAEGEDDKPSAPKGRRAEREGGTKEARHREEAAEPAPPPPPAAAAAPAKPDKPAKEGKKPGNAGETQDLDALLNEATKGAEPAGGGGATAPSSPAPTEKPEEKLPESLTSKQVRDGMTLVKARVQACYDKYKVAGVVEIKVKIDRDGTIADSDAVGKFAATETGLCVGQAVRHAAFPKFSGPPMNFTYPFRLQ